MLIMKGVFAMDYERLKNAVNKIIMPEDMKKRIVAEVMCSCFEEPSEKEQYTETQKTDKI